MAFIDEVRRSTTIIGDVIKRTYGPLAALNLPMGEATNLRYPLNLGDSKTYPHTVEFQAWEPAPIPMSEMAPNQAASRVISEIGQKSGITGCLRCGWLS